jgi:hypothetical protein
MRRGLIAALILAGLIVCVSGCHVRVTVHAGPSLHGSLTGR